MTARRSRRLALAVVVPNNTWPSTMGGHLAFNDYDQWVGVTTYA